MTKGDRIAAAVVFVMLAYVGLLFRGEKKDSVEQGAAYLASAYTNFSYDDPYLQYTYPGEHLKCVLDGCELTYRLLDGYFAAVLLFREKTDLESLAKQVHDAEDVFAAILPEWRSAPIANAVTNPKGDGIALDTMCIVGYLARDRALAEHVLFSRDGEDNWINETHYRDGAWRNIADETWCLRMLLATGTERETIVRLIQRQKERTDAFLTTTDAVADRLTAVTHMLEVFADAREERFEDATMQYRETLIQAVRGSTVANDLLLKANIAVALTRSGASNEANRIIAELRTWQDDDGAWRRQTGEPLPVLTTARVLTALQLSENQ